MSEPMSAERLAEIREDVETSAWGAEAELLAEVDRLARLVADQVNAGGRA